MKCDLFQVYGLTETTGAITIMMPDDHDLAKGNSDLVVKRLMELNQRLLIGNDLEAAR